MPVMQQGRKDGSIRLAKAPLGACADSPLQPQEKLTSATTAAEAMVPLPSGLCQGQGCDTELGGSTTTMQFWFLWSMQHLIHAWFLFVEKQGTEVAASSANVSFCIYSVSTVKNLGQIGRG